MEKILQKYALMLCCLCIATSLYAQKSLRFERNQGQWDKEILYKAERKEGKVFLRRDRVSFLIFDSLNASFHPHALHEKEHNDRERYSIFSLKPLNAKNAKIEELNLLAGVSNYFKGRDKTKWARNVRATNGVIYKEIYSGIDWQVEEMFSDLKHTFIVHPYADANEIKLEYVGVESLTLQNNSLVIQTKHGTITENPPYIYQKQGDEEIKIDGHYIITGNVVSYSIPDYDRSKTLYIDPGLVFSTYIGSHSDSWGMTSCYDNYGMMISGGIVHGAEYPYTEGSYDTLYNGDWDCVVTKYDTLGHNLVFSTFLGGNKGEMPHSMICNQNDEILVFGTTGSTNFPTSDNAFQTQMHNGENLIYEGSISYNLGSDIFVACLNSNGNDLVASTLIGGSANDGLNYRPDFSMRVLYDGNDSLYYNYGDIARGEIITDSANNVYVASCTFSTDFPITNGAFQQQNNGGQEAVIFKFDHSLSSLLFSTYLGGNNNDASYSLDIDNQGKIYVCGGTTSANFPTTPLAYNTTFNGGSTDAFISIFSNDGTSLIASTFYGSNAYDQSYFIKVDKDNCPHIFGQTKAQNSTLVHNVGYAIPNSGQFVAKFSPLLDTLVWSTVFGTGNGFINISPSGFNVDICGRIYCSGWGRVFKYMASSLGYLSLGTTNMQTTPDAYMTTTDGQDFYVMALEPNATSLKYASFFGENSSSANQGADHVDGGTSRFDRYGNLYQTICASCGGSQNFPTTDSAWSSQNPSTNCNMASLKFSIANDFAVADFIVPEVACKDVAVSFENRSRATSYQWFFGDNTTSTATNPTHTYTESGLYEVKLVAMLNDACRERDTITKNVLILSDTTYRLDTLYTCASVPLQIGMNYFNTQVNNNLVFHWYPQNLVSDSSISNPYATISSPTEFTLIIDNGVCSDTLHQYVDLINLNSNLPDTIEFCSLPYTYSIPANNGVNVIASWSRDFDTLLPVQYADNEVIITDTNKFLYIKFTQGSCINIDSVWLRFKGYDFVLQTYDVGCSMSNNGRAEVVSHSFETNVHYTWSCSNQDVSSVENLQAGTYTVTLSDENGCSTQKTFEIGTASNLSVEVLQQNNSCPNLSDGQITLIVSGGNFPYTYSWSNLATDSLITNLAEGVYSYSVSDASGCEILGQVHIQPLDSVQISLSHTDNNCDLGCSATINSLVNGGSLPYTYEWSNGEATPAIYDLCNGHYSLLVTDDKGCTANAETEIINIDAFANFVVNASATEVYDGNKVTLEASNISGFDYSWTPSENLSNPHSYITTATVYQTTTYVVYLTDNKGCSKEDSVTVYAEYVQCEPPNIFVPNVFTPNSDGKNDLIRVSGEYIQSIDFAIYDRWGEKVFHTTDLAESWDGNFRNSPCQAGVYYYRLEVNCYGGKVYLSGGDITLIR